MLYRYKDGSGQTVYSDQPPPAGASNSSVAVIKNGVVVRNDAPTQKEQYDKAKGYIKGAKKHIPKAMVYVEYIEYLRKMYPARYLAYMRDLAKSDPESYVNLTKAGLFRPLKAHQRLANVMDGGVMVAGDLFAGRSGFDGAASYAEKTLVDYMKKDKFIPPDVLGSKGTTLPKQVPQFSNTRLGQWSKAEDVRSTAAAAKAGASLSNRTLIDAGAKAATRVAGPVLDVMIGALDPGVYSGVQALIGPKILEANLAKKGIFLDPDELLSVSRYIGQGNIEAVKNIVREAALRSKK